MATAGLINPNPTIYQVSEILRREGFELTDDELAEGFDSLEVFGTSWSSFSFNGHDSFTFCIATVCCANSPSIVTRKPVLTSNLVAEIHVPDLIRKINDPEHPLTLEQLNVTKHELIKVSNDESYIQIHFTPTIPHCSMATLIGLCIRVKLLRSLPGRFKVDINITPGTHASEAAVNKQLNDKERVAAALENSSLLGSYLVWLCSFLRIPLTSFEC